MTPGTGHGEKLTRKKEQAVAALLEQPTVRRAAAAAGVSERALRLWLRQPNFKAAYGEARRQLLEHALSRLQRASQKAVGTLVRALRAGRDGDRIRAALGILDRAMAGGELLDVLGRVEALEETAARRQEKGDQ
jgi:hypothetical protein